jgi:DNA invertase Pin-like site-specific DNA recombinase
MVLNIITSMGQWEREMISERARAALQRKRWKGERTGNIPFGWISADDEVHLVKAAAAQKVIKQILELRARGVTFASIASFLKWEAIKRRHGSAVVHQMVRAVLLRATKAPSHERSRS